MQLFTDEEGFYLTPNICDNGNTKAKYLESDSQCSLQHPGDLPGNHILTNFNIVSQSTKAMQRQKIVRNDHRTILWIFQKRTRTRRITTSYLSESKESIETQVDFFFSLPEIFKGLGVARGFLMNSRESTELSYSLQTFHAVPANAPIFEFCREGNIARI